MSRLEIEKIKNETRETEGTESKGTEQEPIDLKTGDIVYEISITKDGPDPIHTWTLVSQEPKIAHSSIGSSIVGVTRHSFINHKVYGDAIFVLRCNNSILEALITQVAERFTPIMNSDELAAHKALNVEACNLKKINVWQETKVTFSTFSTNRESDSSQSLNTFRAVRAALRSGITNGKTVPLSKIRGLSCNQFIDYTIQAALVILVLGNQLNQLQARVNSITEARRIKDHLGRKDPASHLLGLFYQEFLKLAEEQKLPDHGLKKDEILAGIAFPVKGNVIEESMNYWKSTPFFAQIEGKLFGNPPKIQPQSLTLDFTDNEENTESEVSSSPQRIDPLSLMDDFLPSYDNDLDLAGAETEENDDFDDIELPDGPKLNPLSFFSTNLNTEVQFSQLVSNCH